MSSSEKLEMAKRKGICYRCLGDKHLSRFCNSQELCNIKTNGQNCNKPHHYLLHESFTIPVSNYNAGCCHSNGTLLCVSTIYSYNTPITVMWDSASDITLITHKKARSLGAHGKNAVVSISKLAILSNNVILKDM